MTFGNINLEVSKTILGRWMGQSSKPFPDFLGNSGNHQWEANYYHVDTMGTILVKFKETR